jgi:4-hydroxybenzoate polyprenyltransferase
MLRYNNYIKLIRFKHYVKNLIIFAPLFFGLKLFQLELFFTTFFIFIAFSFAASSVYILNDYFDREVDRSHPVKKDRLIAAGKISQKEIFFIVFILLAASFFISSFININSFYFILSYVALNIFYSFKLKHIPIIDVFILSMGFIIRLLIGSEIANVDLSIWIIIMTFLLAIFLALAKRRDDVLLYLSNGVMTRKVVDGYNLEFLNSSMVIMASVIIVSYIMYTISPVEIVKIHSDKLYLTTIFVIFGILRYLQITFVENKKGDPTEIFIKDKFIQLAVVAWIISFGIFLYF